MRRYRNISVREETRRTIEEALRAAPWVRVADFAQLWPRCKTCNGPLVGVAPGAYRCARCNAEYTV